MFVDALKLVAVRCNFLLLSRVTLGAYLLWVIGMTGIGAQTAHAQDRPSGVVWQQPDRCAQAQSDLRQMHAMGVEAVRTGWVEDEQLLALADSLGLQFYQDAPLAYRTAPDVNRVLPLLREPLRSRLRMAEAHPSARHFGLGRMLDTSDPAACSAIEQLADYVRAEGPPGVQVYYVTPFGAADRCASAVDLVLLDALDADPVAQINRWQAHHPEIPAGIGRMGTWIDSTAAAGLSAPHSAEAQARYLETHLTAVQAEPGRGPFFIYHWRDRVDDPYGRRYGLYAPGGTPRPAAEVVRGLYTGQQTVFAFAPGRHGAGPSVPWLVVIGWGGMLLLGWRYAREPRFRHMTARYFRAHAFYQEAMRSGRDLLVGSSLALLAAEGVSLATLGVVAGRQLRFDASVVHALQAVPGGLRAALATLLGTPWSLGVLVGAGYALLLILWMLLLVFGSRWGRWGLTVEQGVVLVVWPRWPLLAVWIGALVASTLEPLAAQKLLMALGAALAGAVPFIMGRTLIDYAKITRVPGSVMALAIVLSPFTTALYLAALEVWRNDVPLRFIWHLLTRT